MVKEYSSDGSCVHMFRQIVYKTWCLMELLGCSCLSIALLIVIPSHWSKGTETSKRLWARRPDNILPYAAATCIDYPLMIDMLLDGGPLLWVHDKHVLNWTKSRVSEGVPARWWVIESRRLDLPCHNSWSLLYCMVMCGQYDIPVPRLLEVASVKKTTLAWPVPCNIRQA